MAPGRANLSDDVTPERLAGPLAAFLEKASEFFGGDLARAADHLMYPAEPSMTLMGSDLGSHLWNTVEGRRLLALLLQDPQLGTWFGGGPLDSLELRSIIASAVRSCGASHEVPERYAQRQAAAILGSLREETKSCWALGFGYGVRVARRFDLPRGLAIDPDVKTPIEKLGAHGTLAELDIMRLQKGYSCLFLQGAAVTRGEFGAFAGTTAASWWPVAFDRLKKSIWMVCGALPVIGDVFVTEVSEYPITPFRRFPAPLQMYPRQPTTTLREDEYRALRDTILRLGAVWDGTIEDMDRETYLQLRLALSHMHAVLTTPDSLLAALLAYVAVDGLLLYQDEEASRLVPRVGWLVGVDKNDRRALRTFVDAFGHLRGDVGHGNPPRLRTLSRLVGRQVMSEEVDVHFSWVGAEAGQILGQRCRNLLRKVLLSFINLAIEVTDDGNVALGLTRRQLINTLESAARGGPESDTAALRLEANARSLPAQ